MGNPVSVVDFVGETLAQFKAKVVGDATYAAVIESLKSDKSGQAAAASQIVQKVGRIWANAIDDFFQAAYPYIREVATRSIKLDDWAAPDDNTDLNATTAGHGLLPKLDGSTAKFLNGAGGWTTLAAPSAYAEGAVSFSQSVTSGVAFTIFETAEIPEGFAGVVVYEYYAWGGNAGASVCGHTINARANLRRFTAGSLSVADTGQAAALGEGATWTNSPAANSNAFRVQLTLGSSTTVYVRGHWRIYGAVL